MFPKSILQGFLLTLLFAASASAIAWDPIAACSPKHNGKKRPGDPCKYWGKTKAPTRPWRKYYGTCVPIDGAELNANLFPSDLNLVFQICGHPIEIGHRRRAVEVLVDDLPSTNVTDAKLASVAVEFRG